MDGNSNNVLLLKTIMIATSLGSVLPIGVSVVAHEPVSGPESLGAIISPWAGLAALTCATIYVVTVTIIASLYRFRWYEWLVAFVLLPLWLVSTYYVLLRMYRTEHAETFEARTLQAFETGRAYQLPGITRRYHLATVLRYDPMNHLAIYYLARELLRANKPEAALRKVDQAIQLQHDNSDYTELRQEILGLIST